MARGFFAELQHQAKLAAREQARQEREAQKAHRAAVRSAEQARKAEERAAAQFARATAAERKRLEKEAKAAHVAAKQAEAERQNSELARVYDEIDSILAATLDVDDYVDLNTLKVAASHPAFARVDLESPTPPPGAVSDPPEPILIPPLTPSFFGAIFGKKKHAAEVERANREHEANVARWNAILVQNEAARKHAADESSRAEAQRVRDLEAARDEYAQECAARDAQCAEHNALVDALIANLGYGTADAVREYVSIVLANSVYPEYFPVRHEYSFDAPTAELRLRALISGPDKVPSIKAYKYTKSSDEITFSSLSQKACKERYAGAVHQVALRTLHEVFEADRRGLIGTITLEVGTETIDPGTGLDTYVPFVAAAAERDAFLKINLENVMPTATLEHLGASVSKNPFGLVPARVKGVRRS